MHPMIERVARAIANELSRQDGLEGGEWVFEDGCKLAFLDQEDVDLALVARAAIQALIEPEKSMLDAGLYQGTRNMPLRDQYQAMLQTILNEGEG